MTRAPEGRQRGVALLEVLVAFGILAISVTVLTQGLASGARNQRLAVDRLGAASRAESLLARLGADLPLALGETRGEIDGRYRWHLMATPLTPAPLGRTTLTPAALALTVTWDDRGRERAFDVRTTRLVAAGR